MKHVEQKTPRIVEVRRSVLGRNDLIAGSLRRRFAEAGVFVVSLVSSPGAGKTAMLERTLRELSSPLRRRRVAALVGDLSTDHDAQRLARSGAPVRQITTNTTCHLEAEMIETALVGWNLAELDVLFIENVGNLVCPAGFDLGEHLRVVLLCATEGEDKPLKYPTIFNTADAAVVTKIDLAAAVEFDREVAHRSIHAVRPRLPIFELSAKTGAGFAAWLEVVEAGAARVRGASLQA